MKKLLLMIMSTILVSSLIGCSTQNQPSLSQEKIKPVKVMLLKEETLPITLEYIGLVDAQATKKFSFKSPGKIEAIFVAKGEKVHKGDKLTRLNTQDLSYAVQVAKSQLETTQAQYNKANKGASAEQLKQAEINYQQKQDMLQDATIISDIDGYIVDVLNKEGEMISAGYPVIIARNENNIVNVGLSSEDIDKVKLGLSATIEANGHSIDGEIIAIDSIPDTSTRTYNVEIDLPNNPFKIGEIVNVSILLNNEKGIWIPITSILKNGESYVYVVENEHTVRKKVELGAIKKSNVLVNGLNAGDQLVIDGYRAITDGDKVAIKP